jgi:hypothetical protein
MSLRRLGAAVQEFGFSDGAPRLAEQDRALDHVLELAHVPRELEPGQRVHGVGGGAMPATRRPGRLCLATKSAKIGMSSRRSRSAGTRIRNTFSRKKRSSRARQSTATTARGSEAITSLAAEESHETGLSLIALDPVRVRGFDNDR